MEFFHATPFNFVDVMFSSCFFSLVCQQTLPCSRMFPFPNVRGSCHGGKKQSSSNSEHLNGKTQKSYVFMRPCYCCFRSHSYYCNILDTYSIMTRLLGDNCLLSLSYPTPVTSRFRISIYKI